VPLLPAPTVQHVIYPLNATSGYGFDDGGEIVDISPENFWRSASRGDIDEWGLSTGYNVIAEGDWVWAYFCAPIAQILGVGVVEGPVDWNPRWGRHSLHIRWNAPLTRALKASPIDYGQYQQRVQTTGVRANDSTKAVLQDWLRGRSTRIPQPRAHQVDFVERAVQQRLGQGLFRASVVRAFGGACAVTGTRTPHVLQAAHISGVRKGGVHAVENALLLRADLHNLFDLGLLTIGSKLAVEVDTTVADAEYRALHGRKVSPPRGVNLTEWRQALATHRAAHRH
jgi:hypothetical protein